MKTKGGGKKKGMGSSDALALEIPSGIEGAGGNADGCQDSMNENSGSKPINGFSSPAPSMDPLTETLHDEEIPEETEENGKEDEEEEDDEDGEEADATAAFSERKLDEGFYEIETIRRKRIRKGQLQYFIKWRGWPETANTWEPLENLQSCSDVIESFEESLRSGKPRKRKRRQGVVHTQLKKRQQCSDVETRVADKFFTAPLSTLDLSGSSQPVFSNCKEETDRNGKHIETPKQVIVENGCANSTQQIDWKEVENEYDPKISELKASLSNCQVNYDKLGLHFQEPHMPEANLPVNETSKAECGEHVQVDRCTGAKRRKSGSVKRFKQDATFSEVVASQNAIIPFDIGSGAGVGNSGLAGESLGRNNKNNEPRNMSGIIKIIKPIGYSHTVSNNIQDVLVTFMALRADGTEVMVDNKFLKANNPLLLINFYEQHLRYTPAP